MKLTEFDYHLPKELIAQFPAKCRDQSRLLIIKRKSGRIIHTQFRQIVEMFNPDDALVLNDTQVRPVRLIGKIKEKNIDILLVKRLKKNCYLVKAKPGSKLKPGLKIEFNNGNLVAACRNVETLNGSGMKMLEFQTEQDMELALEQVGMMPLPPYIKRSVTRDDAGRYQTVYAKNPGAIASPTAGLHFTKQLLEQISLSNVSVLYLTLHVGLGTFTPVHAENVSEHKMHEEWFDLPKHTAEEIEKTRKSNSRICAVGTTVCRVLESCAQGVDKHLILNAGSGRTDIFIYPPYRFKVTDMLLTNFHLPKTTLLMLVYAFAGAELAKRAYEEAVRLRYRFYSYGDCMLII